MMHPEHMDRVTIVTPQKHSKQAIEILYNHGVLHIVDHTKGKLDIGSPLPGSAQVADLLVKARSVMHSLGIDRLTTPATTVIGDLAKQITTIHEQTIQLLAEQKTLEEEALKHETERHAYNELRWLKVNPVKLRNSKHLTYFFGTVEDNLKLEHDLTSITPKHYYERQPQGKGVLVLVDNEKAAQTRDALQARGFVALDYSRIITLNKPLDKHLRELDQELHRIKSALAENKHQQLTLAKQHAPVLVAAESLLAVEAKKAQAPLRFGVTKNAVFINGWVPTANRQELVRDLEAQLGSEAHVQIHGHSAHDDAPIKLNNSFAVAPFEALLRLYTLPKYHEIDPSTFLFLSFPIFFGFMLGDIGYGLVLLAIFMIMRAVFKASKEISSLASIIIMSSVSSVIFGILFGEFFGAEHIGHLELHPLIHRTHDMTTLLAVAIAVGVIHITIALIIGFLNELHHMGAWKAFCAKISWIVLLAAVALIAVGYTLGQPTIIPGYILAIISVILIYLGEGVKGLIELPGIFSNIMSYARLMALGVASAALAIVINELSGPLFHSGTIGGVIGGLLILVIGHIINILLGLMGAFLHSLRLHYVEFFSKFYQGGGKPYKPFGVDEL